MRAQRTCLSASLPLLTLALSAAVLKAQGASGSLPATAPTAQAPLSATAPSTGTGLAQEHHSGHAAEVTCAGGQLEVKAQNSSLNQVLRAISRCTGMRVDGRVAEQRIFGNYGPATPATVLATLLDGTGVNMLLQETAADQPAVLILTPRTGGATPPPPANSAEAEDDEDAAPAAAVPQNPYRQAGQRVFAQPGQPPRGAGQAGQTAVPQPNSGSAVTSPPSIPQPTNNPLGNPANASPTASTYPTANSVPLDTVATPSTTPSVNGIVDAPNPPAAGSDTAALLNGAPGGTPGTTNISPSATGSTSSPGGTNTTVPAMGTNPDSGQLPSDPTPEQIFQQLQQRQQQQQQQQQQENNPQ